MIQTELRAVEQGPKDVGDRVSVSLAAFACLRIANGLVHESRRSFKFLGAGPPGKRGKVKRLDAIRRVQERRVQESGERLAALQRGGVGDDLAVHQRQGLQYRGLRQGGPLALVGELRQKLRPR